MNNCKAISTIKSILKDNDRDRICILIDGQWGIGKLIQ
ncbi:P-loop NTPase fold protein [Clostridium septicum]